MWLRARGSPKLVNMPNALPLLDNFESLETR
jgi:hypothetical protein